MTERQRFTYPLTQDELQAALAQGRRERALAFARWLSPRRRDEERMPEGAQPAH